MGQWIQARRGISIVHLQIALLIFAFITAAASLTYYFATRPQ